MSRSVTSTLVHLAYHLQGESGVQRAVAFVGLHSKVGLSRNIRIGELNDSDKHPSLQW
jgi:hypothetical protein